MTSSKLYVACSVALLLLSGATVQADEWKSVATAHSSGYAVAGPSGTKTDSVTKTKSKGSDIKNKAMGSATAMSTYPVYDYYYDWWGKEEHDEHDEHEEHEEHEHDHEEYLVAEYVGDDTSKSMSTAMSKSNIDEAGKVDNNADSTMKAVVMGDMTAKATGSADAKAYAKIYKKKDDTEDDHWKRRKPTRKWKRPVRRWKHDRRSLLDDDEWKSVATAHSSGYAVAGPSGTKTHSVTKTKSKGSDIKNKAMGSATAMSTYPVYDYYYDWWGKEHKEYVGDDTSKSMSTAMSKSNIDEAGKVDNNADSTMKAVVMGDMTAKATGSADAKAYAKIYKKKDDAADDTEDDTKIWKKKKPTKKWKRPVRRWKWRD